MTTEKITQGFVFVLCNCSLRKNLGQVCMVERERVLGEED